MLISTPILAMSQDEGTFVLDVDASNFAAGVTSNYRIFQQNVQCLWEKVLYYKKRMAALVFRLKQYRQYLLGRHFLVRTDHAALMYLRSAKELIGQQARWLDFTEEFQFNLQHRVGTAHGNADALSRKIQNHQVSAEQCSQCCRGSPAWVKPWTHVRTGVTN